MKIDSKIDEDKTELENIKVVDESLVKTTFFKNLWLDFWTFEGMKEEFNHKVTKIKDC